MVSPAYRRREWWQVGPHGLGKIVPVGRHERCPCNGQLSTGSEDQGLPNIPHRLQRQEEAVRECGARMLLDRNGVGQRFRLCQHGAGHGREAYQNFSPLLQCHGTARCRLWE